MSYVLECRNGRQRWFLAPVSEQGPVGHLPSLRTEAERILRRAEESHLEQPFRVRIKDANTEQVFLEAVV